MPVNAVGRLAARLSDLAGAPVVLERPSDPAHGDYATNVALRTAPQHRRPPKELAAELAERAAELEEIEVTESSGQGGRTIRELDIRNRTGALIVAVRKRDGTFDTTPTPEALLDVGDVLIAAGTEEELRALEQLFAPRETVAR